MDFFASLLLLEPALPKRYTRAARETLPSYDLAWLTNTNSYLDAISLFQKLIFDIFPLAIDPVIQHTISSAIISAVVAAMTSTQIKYKEKRLVLRKMIKKVVLFGESGSSTPLLNLIASSKLFPLADLPSKATKKWN